MALSNCIQQIVSFAPRGITQPALLEKNPRYVSNDLNRWDTKNVHDKNNIKMSIIFTASEN